MGRSICGRLSWHRGRSGWGGLLSFIGSLWIVIDESVAEKGTTPEIHREFMDPYRWQRRLEASNSKEIHC